MLACIVCIVVFYLISSLLDSDEGENEEREKVTKKNKQKTKTEENVMRKRILGIAAISICLFLAGCSYQDYKEGTGVFYEGPQKSEFGLRTL